MTRDEATQLVQEYLRAQGVHLSPGLNPKGLGGVSVGEAQLYFEHSEDTGELKCSALIYRFRDAPRPGVLEGFRAEQAAGTDAGGGTVDFEPESKSLFLSRSYQTPPIDLVFASELSKLMAASLRWGSEVFERVAAKVIPAK
ncbi:type III secretion system chaperone [Myxococcus fulvus]|uniref:type III secretion system chaperone n=1 Tax=Myxococcus fulvus TaxID=33 RepID=UPI003B9CBA73